MTEYDFLLLKKKQVELYSNVINGKQVSNTDFLEILIRKLEAIDYADWGRTNKIQSHLDIRYQLMARIETATVHYYQSIKSTIRDVENIWNDTQKLGYSLQFIKYSIDFREVSLRTTFLEKVFFAIDYFIQQMNTYTKFHQTGSTHKKQQYFRMLMAKLGVDTESMQIDQLIDDLNKHIRKEELKNLFVKGVDRKIYLFDFYNYLVAFRNVFHNNGYSQKSLNLMNIGGVPIKVKKGEQVDMGHDSVVTIVYMILFPLLKIIEASFQLYSEEYWEDPYTREIKDFVDSKKTRKK